MIVLRKFSESDRGVINQYLSKSLIDRYLNNGRYRLLSILGIYNSQLWLLTEDETVIGMGVIRHKIDRHTFRHGWYLYDIFIFPSFQGKGYGKIIT